MTTTARRCITIPLYIALAACLPLLLFALPFAAVFDIARRTNWATVRALLFFAVYITCEAVGIIAATFLWLVRSVVRAFDDVAYLRANFRLQCYWATALLRSAERIFGMVLHVSGSDAVRHGPILVFARHASTADTVLPAVLISAPHGIVLRYVMKKELLWDPCLDIVGHRLKNYFVDRHSDDRSREIEAVAQLADGMAENEGVMIYPEGTRFSTSKRERAITLLAAVESPDLVERARRLRHVLPPRFGGPLALLQRNRDTDLVVLGHTGFEGIERLSDLINGALIGRVIEVRFWRISREQIPTDTPALRTWLIEQWTTLDQWIETTRGQRAV